MPDEHVGQTSRSKMDPIEYQKSWSNFWRNAGAVAVGGVVGGLTVTLVNSIIDRSSDTVAGAVSTGGVSAGGAFGF